MKYRSLTVRLTIWYALIFAVTLALADIVLVLSLRTLLYRDSFNRLASRAQEVAQMIQGYNHHGHAGDAEQEEITDHILVIDPNGLLVQLAKPNGIVMNRSGNLGTDQMPVPRTPTTMTESIIKWHGHSLAWLTRPVWKRNKLAGSVQVGLFLNEVDIFLSLTLRTAFGLLVGAISIAVLGGLVLAKTALRPVRKLTEAAAHISLHELDQVLEAQGPKDELYLLTITFNAMLRRIRQAVKIQQDFVVAASHELRTPLAIIQGYASLLARWGQEEPAVRANALNVFSLETERMGRLVDELILLAKGGLQEEVPKEEVDLSALFQALTEEFRVLRPNLKGDWPTQTVTVLASIEDLRRLFSVLLENAIKYSPPESPIEISLKTENDLVVAKVRDQGIGIAPEDLPLIFDRFYRGDRARSRRRDGFGLGLAIAKMLAERFGGHIAVESELGQGTSFGVTLPLKKSEADLSRGQKRPDPGPNRR